MKKKQYTRGKHPHSQENLALSEGRPCLYSSPKKKRNISMTEEGWEDLKILAKNLGYPSVSEFLEKISRGQVKISA